MMLTKCELVGVPVGVIQGRNENENLMETNFVSLDQTLGSLMPGDSLSVYLKQRKI